MCVKQSAAATGDPCCTCAPSAPPYGICRSHTFCQPFMSHTFLLRKNLTERFFSSPLSTLPDPPVSSQRWETGTTPAAQRRPVIGSERRGGGGGASAAGDVVPLSKAGCCEQVCYNQQQEQEVQIQVTGALFVFLCLLEEQSGNTS